MMPTHEPFLSSVFSVGFFEDPYMRDWQQVRFPRSKKRRMRKKWAKQRRNFGFAPSPRIYRIGDTIIGHPEVIAKIKRKLKKVKIDETHAQENI